jgi:GntR family transcriptional regulator, transcriptional repressor for pyruvate dehydrogenase complex
MMAATDFMTLGVAIEREGSLSERLAARIEAAIGSGELQVGTPFPSERLVAEQFGVSRTVVREAVRTLVARGLLDVRAGAGTIVTNPSLPHVASSITLLMSTSTSKFPYEKVIEARRVLEVEIAGLAAERRTEVDLLALGAAAEALRVEDLELERFVEADMAFHRGLAKATQNELLEILADSVAHVMIRVRAASFEIPGTVSGARYHHGRILAAVRRGDGQASRLAMKRHLAGANRALAKVREV